MQTPTPEQIALQMDGNLHQVAPGRFEALLPSPCIQNHAAFLSVSEKGLQCLWFGGSLEGKSDISVWRSTLADGIWSNVEQLSFDPDRSEQNPIQFRAPDGRCIVLNTAQVGGNQDDCAVMIREDGCEARRLPLPPGTFIRAPILVREDGAWLLPLFRCVSRKGERWNGSHDTAAVAISADGGANWREVEVPGSTGCVHMTLVSLGDDRFAALYRRRQADFVYRAESIDGGESWSTPVATDVPNNNSSISAIGLADGRVAMACNPVNATMFPDARRASLYDELGEDDARPDASGGCDPIWGVPRAPMTICFSGDGGMTFPRRVVVEDGPGTCLSNNSTDGRNKEMSYPSLVETPGGGIDLAYTYFRRAIKHVRLTSEWLEAQ